MEGCGFLVILNTKSTQILNFSEVSFEIEVWATKNMDENVFCRPVWRLGVETWSLTISSSLLAQDLLRFRISVRFDSK